jgi:hypothetical protein
MGNLLLSKWRWEIVYKVAPHFQTLPQLLTKELDLYVAFATDPSSLLNQGWPKYNPDGQAMVFGLEKQATSLSPVINIHAPCSSNK